MYDTNLIREVTDPRTGIMTAEKYMSFMPNAGELKVYCDAIAARKERIERLGSLPQPAPGSHRLAPPEPLPGDLATVFIPDTYQRYSYLVDKAKEKGERFYRFGKSSDGRNGIWVAWIVWDDDGKTNSRTIGEAAKSVAA